MANPRSDVTFRPLHERDLPLLADWLDRAHVKAWWGNGEALRLADIRSQYLPRPDAASPVRSYIAQLNGEPIGFAQSYVAMRCGGGWWQEETDPGVVGIDLFLGDEARLGQGLGTQLAKAFVRQLLLDPGVTKVQTDPDPANARAIRCYEKAGFRRVGIVATPDGPALLMIARRTDWM